MASISNHVPSVFSSVDSEYGTVIAWRKNSDCPHEADTPSMQALQAARKQPTPSIYVNTLPGHTRWCAVLQVTDKEMQEIMHRVIEELGINSISFIRILPEFRELYKDWPQQDPEFPTSRTGKGKYRVDHAILPYKIDLATNQVTEKSDNTAFGGFFFYEGTREAVVSCFCEEAAQHPAVRAYVEGQKTVATSTLFKVLLKPLLQIICEYL